MENIKDKDMAIEVVDIIRTLRDHAHSKFKRVVYRSIQLIIARMEDIN